jgi:Zn-dependent protease
MDANAFRTLILSIIPFLLAITVHESAHGWVAYKKGDYTAKMLGRITMNPIRHLDPLGSVLVPILLAFSGAGVIFGWAKPVPVNSFNFKSPRRDMMYVGLAGPLSNFLLAAVLALVLRVLLWVPGPDILLYSGIGKPIAAMLLLGIKVSIYLGVFNLLPIHPLDGSHILEGLLPPEQSKAYSRLSQYGAFVLIILLFTGVLTAITFPLYAFIFRIISGIFGL